VDQALTSVVAGRLAHPDARTVVLVNATGGAAAFGEALAGAPLAVAQGAPLLLTGATALPSAVARDVTARHATTAWLVGSTTSITPAVEQQLHGLGVTTVTRVSGADKWATAAAVALRVGAPTHEAVLVPGDPGELLDALVAAGPAAATGRPILLTGRTGVPAATLAALRTLKVTSVTVVGSTAAVPEKTLTALAAAGVTTRTRLVGKGRWATAAAIATTYAPKLPADRLVLTSGMVAGPDLLIAAAQGRPVLLATVDVLPTNTADWLRAHRALRVSVVAAPDLVGTTVLRAVQNTRG
jgi:putative cell wall-binding protein